MGYSMLEYPITKERITMNIEDLIKEAKEIEEKSEFIVSWFAKKYKKTIRRVGHLKEDYKGNKLMCFWDPVINRYTTCINPVITYKKGLN